jgi:H+/Cl- antiporter ClcA
VEILNDYKRAMQFHSGKLAIFFKCIIVGLIVSVIAILYRLALTKSESFSLLFYGFIREYNSFILPMLLLLTLAGWLLGLFVKKYPMISGSGIPQVKGQIMGHFNNPWLSTLIMKFIGGIISILAGLSMGREGPTIQLGAAAADGFGQHLSITRTEKKMLIASGACAGLAAAFNAPLAGVIFALEEIFTYFSPTILLATISVAITADFISKLIFGMEPIFHLALVSTIPLAQYWLLLLLGVIAGAAGAVYNTTLLKTINTYKKLPILRAGKGVIVPFLFAGILGLTFPIVLGGGHQIIEQLDVNSTLQWIIVVLLVKFGFSIISFGSGAPGGIFFPLLVIGALIGGLFGNLAINIAGVNSTLFLNFVVLAMAGFFSAIVRAPITGIVLLTEMTGSFSHLLPLTIVSLIAYITADLLKSAPIYESLLENLLATKEIQHDDQDIYRKIMVETTVHFGSEIENRKIKDLPLPENSLVIAIRRQGKDITPRGDSVILPEDHLIVLTSLKDESATRLVLRKMAETAT